MNNGALMRLLEALLQSCALMLSVCCLRKFAGKRLDARIIYALWLLPLLRMLMPALPASGASLLAIAAGAATLINGTLSALLPSFVHSESAVSGNVPPISTQAPGTIANLAEYAASNNYPEAVQQTQPMLNDAANPIAAPAQAAGMNWLSALSMQDLALIVWIIGALIVLISAFIKGRKFLHSALVNAKLLQKCGRARVYSAYVMSPCLVGMFRPKIFMPRGVVWSADYELMLSHELTHLRHGDNFWAFFRVLALAMWWFNPLAWICARLSMRDCELACDATVTRGMAREVRTRYGMALLGLVSGGAGTLSASTRMSGDGQIMKERIMNIVKRKKTSRGALAWTLAIIMAALPMCFTTALGDETPIYEAISPDLPLKISVESYNAALNRPYGDTSALNMLAYMIEWQTGLITDEYAGWLETGDSGVFSDMTDAEIRGHVGMVYDNYDFVGRKSADGQVAYILARQNGDRDIMNEAQHMEWTSDNGSGSIDKTDGEGRYALVDIRRLTMLDKSVWMMECGSSRSLIEILEEFGSNIPERFIEARTKGLYLMEPTEGMYMKIYRQGDDDIAKTVYMPISHEEYMKSLFSSYIYTDDVLNTYVNGVLKQGMCLVDADTKDAGGQSTVSYDIAAPLVERACSVAGIAIHKDDADEYQDAINVASGGMSAVNMLSKLLEAQAGAQGGFENISDAEIARIAGELTASYDFIGRKSADGQSVYLLGCANGETDILAGTTFYEVSYPAENGTSRDEIVFERDGEKILSLENAGWICRLTEGMSDRELIYIEPRGIGRSLADAANCISWYGYDYLANLSQRGATVICPNGAYLAVKQLVGGEPATRYIPLTDEEYEAARLEAEEGYTNSPEELNRAIYYADSNAEDVYAEDYFGYNVPKSPFEMAREALGFELTPQDSISGIVSAQMSVAGRDGEQTITDSAKLRRIEEIIASGEKMGGLSKCPFVGVITVTRADGTTATISLAADSCDTFVLGSYCGYEAPRGSLDELWSMFDDFSSVRMS